MLFRSAQGNPRAVEEAKAGIKAALIGYGLAALAPTLVSILQKQRQDLRELTATTPSTRTVPATIE